MEPFDYLTYKQNKQEAKRKMAAGQKEKRIFYWLCLITFSLFFIFAMRFIASKSSKIDIEYGKFAAETEDFDEDEEVPQNQRFSIDKRLFIIQQEEKAPSMSRPTEQTDQAEVISPNEFELIKTNSIALSKDNENPSEKADNAVKTPEAVKEKPVETQLQDGSVQKLTMKPKIPEAPVARPISALNISSVPSKVLVGKFSSPEEAGTAKTSLQGAVEGASPFVKKIGGIYTVQVGSYENFEIAKTIAAKLKSEGFDVWIFQ